MNADRRRGICSSLVAVVLGTVVIASPASADEFQSQLSAEIERRFSASLDDSENERIIESAFPLTREVAEGRAKILPLKLNFEYKPEWRPERLEGVDALPQRTLVESSIGEGFPTCEMREPRCNRTNDFSYLLADGAIRPCGFNLAQ